MLLPSGWRALHADLVRSLLLVEGEGSSTNGYHNVLVIVDVLDVYRTLVEMVRACFGRLGQLLDNDDSREATKAVDVRIMGHALWALTTYEDDVDLQLVRITSTSQKLTERGCTCNLPHQANDPNPGFYMYAMTYLFVRCMGFLIPR